MADDQHAIARSDADLFLNLQRRRERLDEHRFFVGDFVRNGMQILNRKGEEFREGAIAVFDSQDRAPLAVRRAAGTTRIACIDRPR